jgi:glutathione S-transferase
MVIPNTGRFRSPAAAGQTNEIGMKLYRFRYSPFARKVQIVLDLLGERYDVVEVPYGDRTELATLTGGYIYVPVLALADGTVRTESRDICEYLVTRDGGNALVPTPFEGAVWGYHDFADTVVEDLMFRIASPCVRDAWKTAGERALYVLIKERKFGAGCVDAWLRDRNGLVTRAQRVLAPALKTFERTPFLFGSSPTLADAALYGNCIMLEEADADLLVTVAPGLSDFVRRMEAFAQNE